jgi:hypothetical protein
MIDYHYALMIKVDFPFSTIDLTLKKYLKIVCTYHEFFFVPERYQGGESPVNRASGNCRDPWYRV